MKVGDKVKILRGMLANRTGVIKYVSRAYADVEVDGAGRQYTFNFYNLAIITPTPPVIEHFI